MIVVMGNLRIYSLVKHDVPRLEAPIGFIFRTVPNCELLERLFMELYGNIWQLKDLRSDCYERVDDIQHSLGSISLDFSNSNIIRIVGDFPEDEDNDGLPIARENLIYLINQWIRWISEAKLRTEPESSPQG